MAKQNGAIIYAKSTDHLGSGVLSFPPTPHLEPKRRGNVRIFPPSFPSPPPPFQGAAGPASRATGSRLGPGFGPANRSWPRLVPFFCICSVSWCSYCESGLNFLALGDAPGSIFGLFKGSVAWRSHLNPPHPAKDGRRVKLFQVPS